MRNRAADNGPPRLFSFLSVRSFFLLVVAGITLLMFSVLLWAGVTIMNTLVYQFGTEILFEKLDVLLYSLEPDPGEQRLASSLTEERPTQKPEKTILQDLGRFRYKESGKVFVIRRDGEILLSPDFEARDSGGFNIFHEQLHDRNGILRYSTDAGGKLAVYRYHEPWNSYVGISIEQKELFALSKFFVRISLLLLAAFLLSTLLLAGVVQRLIITPLIRLSHFANQVSSGNYDVSLPGTYILELGELRDDMQEMADSLQREMNLASSQLSMLREREEKLDRALTDLKKSEKRYRTIYDAPTDAIFILDPYEGKILDANKAMLMMFGYKGDELHNLSFARLSAGEPPYTAEDAYKRIRLAQEKGAQFFEWLAQKSNGQNFWVEISLRLTDIVGEKQIIAIVRNIHVRKMAEQELATEKEQLAITLRSIGEGVITTDVNGRISLMNRAAERLTGWRQTEAAGRTITDIFHALHPESGKQAENPIDKALFSGQIVEPRDEVVLVSRDGTKRSIMNSGSPINDLSNITIGAVLVFRDITEKKKLEEELFRVNKLESIGVLAGGIAHDFNNILTAILGNVSLARRCIDDAELSASLLTKTEKAAMKAKDLTAQLLTFSHGGKPVMQSMQVEPLLQEGAAYVLRGSGMKVRWDIPDDLWPVEVDPGQFNQVIQNLVINARQAAVDEGELEISCRNIGNCPWETGRCIEINFTDNGCGLSPEVADRVFDPYFTTKEGGSGLGLAICHSIIHRHGGQIRVQSESGRGTTFTIQLPVRTMEETTNSFAGTKEMTSTSKKARILIMDDDQMIIDLSRQILEHLGHEVVTTGDGQAALQCYRKAMAENNPFDVVIMDLTIPGGMGGKEAIKQLLRIDPDASAIVSSGYSHDPVMADYQKYGFKDVIVKPYQVEDLKNVVEKVLRSG
jgi:PAS domain S-box-containing protein